MVMIISKLFCSLLQHLWCMERKMSDVCAPTPRFLTPSALQSYLSFDAFLIWMSATIFLPAQSCCFFQPCLLCQHECSPFVKHLHLILHEQSPHLVQNVSRRSKAARGMWLWLQYGNERKQKHAIMPSATLMRVMILYGTEKKKRPTKLSSSDWGGLEGLERREKKSLDDLNTIIYGPIHSDDVVIWAVIMIVIIIVDEKDFYLGFM